MEEEDSIMPKALAYSSVALLLVAAIGCLFEPPRWMIVTFAFCGSVWLLWPISTLVLKAFNPDWSASKVEGIGFVVGLFIVINVFNVVLH